MQNKLQNVAIVYIELPESNAERDLQETERLVSSARGKVALTITQKRTAVDPYTVVGSGKIDEIKKYIDAYEAQEGNSPVDVVIFSENMNATQRKAVGNVLDKPVLDRVDLILDIFALRATSAEGKKQVELAQLSYNLITKPDKNFSRQGGGIGTRGPGETKLETNKRLIRNRIHHLRSELNEIVKRRELTRKKREENDLFTVALVGYTNAGKSTLFNALTKANAYADDRLFATLDTTVRRTNIDGTDVLMCDTVGFVNNLPHQLVEAFKSTLEEAKYADLILHVLDITDEHLDMHIEVTDKILAELDVRAPVIRVYNKCDISQSNAVFQDTPSIFVSAVTGKNLDELQKLIAVKLNQRYADVTLLLPYQTAGKTISRLHSFGAIMQPLESDDGLKFKVKIKRKYVDNFAQYIVL